MNNPIAIQTKNAPLPTGNYSQAAVANGFLYTAGMGPLTPEGAIVGDEIRQQTQQTMKNLSAVLAANGATWTDVVKVTVHLADLERDRPDFDDVYGTFATAPLPVRTTVGSQLPGILVEIDLVAVLP